MQRLQRGGLGPRVLSCYLPLHHQANTLGGGAIGSSSRRCSIEVVAQNGTFATTVKGSRGNATLRASAWTTRTLPSSENISLRRRNQYGSYSTATTRPATLASWRVSIPPPAPSSTTRSFLPTPDSATIRRAVRLSSRKFWPSSRRIRRRSPFHSSRGYFASCFSYRPSLRRIFRDHPPSSACLLSKSDTGKAGRDPGRRYDWRSSGGKRYVERWFGRNSALERCLPESQRSPARQLLPEKGARLASRAAS